MAALFNHSPLTRPLSVRPDMLATDIRTVSDAALFIRRLPKEVGSRLHWTLAGAALEATDRHPYDENLLQISTLAMENALANENMLVTGGVFMQTGPAQYAHGGAREPGETSNK